jgi:prolyl oligopeptidase
MFKPLILSLLTISCFAINDPYQWVEEMESEKVRTWTEAQNQKFEEYLSANPYVGIVEDHLKGYCNYSTYSLPAKIENRLYFTLQEEGKKGKIYVKAGVEAPELIIDPEQMFSKKHLSLTGFKVSAKQQLLLFGLSDSGSDEQTWYFYDLKEKRLRDETISGIKFSSPDWSEEEMGVYYIRYDTHEKTHCLGVFLYDLEKKEHKELFRLEDEKHLLHEVKSIDSTTLLFHRVDRSGKAVIISLNIATKEVNQLLESDGEAKYCGKVGDSLLFFTEEQAPLGKIVSIDPREGTCIELVGESTSRLYSVCRTENHLVLSYLCDCHSRIKIFDLKGQFVREIDLPGKGKVLLEEQGLEEGFCYSYSDYVHPATIYEYTFASSTSTPLFASSLSIDPSEYETRQVFFSSKDGTQVPMYLVHKKGLEITENTCTLMHGYGGFNVPNLPNYSPLVMTWLEMGHIYVSVNLRGGSEYGATWHKSGSCRNKQNVFDDFVYAALWLIDHGYTTPRRLGITGRSNGGLLVGAALTQRPDLFGACVPQVGVLDMLKFHRFTIGSAWIRDYGNPDDPEDFAYLCSYSPYHNLRPGIAYPATLVTTADHDDRVVPLHSYKFAGLLQEVQAGNSPIFLRTHKNSGHSPDDKQREYGEILSFLLKELMEL